MQAIILAAAMGKRPGHRIKDNAKSKVFIYNKMLTEKCFAL
jgi:hypothetical protein